jgi:hypothetical protein
MWHGSQRFNGSQAMASSGYYCSLSKPYMYSIQEA